MMLVSTCSTLPSALPLRIEAQNAKTKRPPSKQKKQPPPKNRNLKNGSSPSCPSASKKVHLIQL
jgi:hypothetical protein